MVNEGLEKESAVGHSVHFIDQAADQRPNKLRFYLSLEVYLLEQWIISLSSIKDSAQGEREDSLYVRQVAKHIEGIMNKYAPDPTIQELAYRDLRHRVFSTIVALEKALHEEKVYAHS